MNNIITLSHHINNLNQTITNLAKNIADIEKKQTLSNQKLKDMDTLISKLQSRLVDVHVNTNTSSPSPSITEERIKSIVQSYIEANKEITTKEITTKEIPVKEITNPVSETINNDDVLAAFDTACSLYTSIEELSPSNNDDIIIEKKKTKSTTRKTKNTNI